MAGHGDVGIRRHHLGLLPVYGEAIVAINRWVNEGHVFIEIHCGCCAQKFPVELGGSAFCQLCRNGYHVDCKMTEIMKGIKK